MKELYRSIIYLLEKCKTMKELKQLHGLMITTTIIKNTIPCSRVVDFCSNSGHLDYATAVFYQIHHHSVYIWNSMIKGWCSSDQSIESLFLYKEMQRRGFQPDNFTFPFVLKACAIATRYDFGKIIHSRIMKTGYEINVYVSTCLLHMYVSCADMASGLKVFEFIPKWNVVAWSSLIAGYANNDQNEEAIMLFKDMESWNVEPNEITMVNVLAACASGRNLDVGMYVHSRICELGYNPFDSNVTDNVILGTAIVEMYAKCGQLSTARELFDKMPERNLVAWNSMMGAYNRHGRSKEVLDLFADMRIAGISPDEATFLSLIGACTHLESLALGESLHGYISKGKFNNDMAIGTALLNMYAKMGQTKSAQNIFDNMEKKDVMAWTAMIISLAMNGKGEEALKTFQTMHDEALILPDQITYIGVLSACSHLGMVEDSKRHFEAMTAVHGLEPTIEHYGCMVDLLSRAGHFEEAEKLMERMPIQPNVAMWSALLNGCEMYENVSLASKVKSNIAQFRHKAGGVCVLLANIYAKAGKWQEAKLARDMAKQRGIGKAIGQSSVEIQRTCSLPTRLLKPAYAFSLLPTIP